MNALFRDRQHAGQILAAKLQKFGDQPNLVVLGLPRGGVPVAFEVARELHAPLDVFIVRKLGCPGQPELAIGAIASGGVCVLNRSIIKAYRISETEIEETIAQEKAELERREAQYKPGNNLAHLAWNNVILIDDGLATGATMSAAIVALRNAGAENLVVAVPVSSPEICASFGKHVDEIVCAETPTNFGSVGQWYQDFSQTTDEEVRNIGNFTCERLPITGLNRDCISQRISAVILFFQLVVG